MKKIIAILFMLLSLIACNVEKKQVLRVGMEVGYAPFNWFQETGENGAVKISTGYANGYDVKIAKIIAEKLNMKLEIVPSDWDSLLGPAVNSNKIDLVIAGMSPTEERKKSLDFTKAYYNSDIVIVVKKNGNYAKAKKLEDLSTARLTGQLNTIHYSLLSQIKGLKKLPAMENFPSMIVALNSNKIDGYIAEKPSALSAKFSDPNIDFIEFKQNEGFKYNKEEINVAIGLKKGNKTLLNKVNKALSEISDEKKDSLMEEAIAQQPLSGQKNMNFLQWTKQILQTYWKKYLVGTLITLFLASFGTVVGTLIGMVVALVNTSKGNKVLKFINWLYILIFRGTPMIVQAMILYYGLGQMLGINLKPLTAALIIISINTGAYISEILRGGITSIDKGQYEASTSLGFTHKQTMMYIILPQAFRNSLPAIGNEFIVNIKDSSVLFAIGVTELYTISKQVAGTNFRYYEVFLITCLIYFVLTTIFSKLVNYLEKRLDGDTL